MIKNNGCCDLEYAKKLKELGVKQDSVWYWVKEKDNEVPFKNGCELRLEWGNDFYPNYKPATHHDIWGVEDCGYYSAFTVAELGELLPADEEYRPAYYTKRESNGKWWMFSYECDEGGCAEVCQDIYADTEANARAKMLIYLLEYKLIEVKK